jgi:hypothetical protein
MSLTIHINHSYFGLLFWNISSSQQDNVLQSQPIFQFVGPVQFPLVVVPLAVMRALLKSAGVVIMVAQVVRVFCNLF